MLTHVSYIDWIPYHRYLIYSYDAQYSITPKIGIIRDWQVGKTLIYYQRHNNNTQQKIPASGNRGNGRLNLCLMIRMRRVTVTEDRTQLKCLERDTS